MICNLMQDELRLLWWQCHTNMHPWVALCKPGCALDTHPHCCVLAALRNALPKGQYLLSTASWHVGCYGQGAFAASKPPSIYTGEWQEYQ